MRTPNKSCRTTGPHSYRLLVGLHHTGRAHTLRMDIGYTLADDCRHAHENVGFRTHYAVFVRPKFRVNQ